jgi:hypothetical protein
VSDSLEQGGSANGASAADTAGGESVSVISGLAGERPEIVVGAAFAGGLVLAILVRRLGR